VHVAELAAAAHLPTVSSIPEEVKAGGLIAYGISIRANLHRAAYFVDKIQGAGAIDLAGTLADGLSYQSNSHVLNVTNHGTTVAQLNIVGSYTTSQFALASDGSGGTFIHFV
jgi:hypothetical protein